MRDLGQRAEGDAQDALSMDTSPTLVQRRRSLSVLADPNKDMATSQLGRSLPRPR